MIEIRKADFEKKVCSPNCPLLEIELIRERVGEHYIVVLETCKHLNVCRNAVEQFIKNVEIEVADK
jgi:hypothetical protein